jgi:hypothetical protein
MHDGGGGAALMHGGPAPGRQASAARPRAGWLPTRRR